MGELLFRLNGFVVVVVIFLPGEHIVMIIVDCVYVSNHAPCSFAEQFSFIHRKHCHCQCTK